MFGIIFRHVRVIKLVSGTGEQIKINYSYFSCYLFLSLFNSSIAFTWFELTLSITLFKNLFVSDICIRYGYLFQFSKIGSCMANVLINLFFTVAS